MHNYKDLKVWKKGMALVTEAYRLTDGFPESEKFGLISQMRRSAVSVPSNIAEDSGRRSNKEFIRFLDIANSSSFELENQSIIANDLSFISSKRIYFRSDNRNSKNDIWIV